MKVLFVGDMVGKGGRKIFQDVYPSLVKDHSIDFSIANIENAAGGFGATPSIVSEVLSLGVDDGLR